MSSAEKTKMPKSHSSNDLMRPSRVFSERSKNPWFQIVQSASRSSRSCTDSATGRPSAEEAINTLGFTVMTSGSCSQRKLDRINDISEDLLVLASPSRTIGAYRGSDAGGDDLYRRHADTDSSVGSGSSATRKVSPERPPVAAIGFVEGVNRYYRLSPARFPLPGTVVTPGTPRRSDYGRKKQPTHRRPAGARGGRWLSSRSGNAPTRKHPTWKS